MQRFQFTVGEKQYRGKKSPPTGDVFIEIVFTRDGKLQQEQHHIGDILDSIPGDWQGFNKRWFEEAIPELEEEIGAEKVHELYVTQRQIRRSISLIEEK